MKYVADVYHLTRFYDTDHTQQVIIRYVFTWTTWMTNTPNIKNDMVIIERSKVGFMMTEVIVFILLFICLPAAFGNICGSIRSRRTRLWSLPVKNAFCKNLNMLSTTFHRNSAMNIPNQYRWQHKCINLLFKYL